MKIQRYKYSDVSQPGWSFQEVFFGNVNLLVGQSASGKTRLLNTIFNLGLFVVQEDKFRQGCWDIDIEQDGLSYKWELESIEDANKKKIVKHELLKVSNGAEEKILVQRDANQFIFLGNKLPKLSLEKTSIYLLKEEDTIKPLHRGFASILQRSFYKNEAEEQGKILELSKLTIERKYEANKNIPEFILSQPLNTRLFLLQKYEHEKYLRIVEFFKTVFPFIKEVSVQVVSLVGIDLPISPEAPVFCIKEKSVNKWIPFLELSSGMQKVLLILTDIETIPAGSIYLLDEYENSLGTNAIDFFPSYLDSIDKDCQFFITSHHPYLINNINPKDWYVFHRNGSDVKIMYGDKNLQRFGKSKQKAFIQLLNDSFYSEGIE